LTPSKDCGDLGFLPPSFDHRWQSIKHHSSRIASASASASAQISKTVVNTFILPSLGSALWISYSKHLTLPPQQHQDCGDLGFLPPSFNHRWQSIKLHFSRIAPASASAQISETVVNTYILPSLRSALWISYSKHLTLPPQQHQDCGDLGFLPPSFNHRWQSIKLHFSRIAPASASAQISETVVNTYILPSLRSALWISYSKHLTLPPQQHQDCGDLGFLPPSFNHRRQSIKHHFSRIAPASASAQISKTVINTYILPSLGSATLNTSLSRLNTIKIVVILAISRLLNIAPIPFTSSQTDYRENVLPSGNDERARHSVGDLFWKKCLSICD